MIARERAQHGDDRRVGQLALAELDAIARQYASAPISGPRRELGEQARLAHAGVPGHEDEARPAVDRLLERALESGKLG